MFEFIKKHHQKRHLRDLMEKQRDKRIENWENIKTIGMIFTVGDAQRWNLIQRFITAQEKEKKEVYLIGFQEQGYEIDYIFSHTKTTIVHEKEDLNFFRLPKEGVVDTFVDHHYDLLIDTTEQPNFFGKYMTVHSDADLKVGYHNLDADYDEGNMEMYDLAIQGHGVVEFKDYIEQIVRYLRMIQK
ncbi:MAG: hypothetical protein K5864_00605 [Bacteroidales bacterium]|nr:hypothetical protein [Bacteroidales bacterium]